MSLKYTIDTELVKDKESITTVKISKTTHQRLVTRGKWGETLDDILARVLDELDDCDKAKGKK